jgi:HrpA-like RNA helicase
MYVPPCVHSGGLTPLGHGMAMLPVEPVFGSLLLRAEPLHCLIDVIDIVAMLSSDNSFFAPKELAEKAKAARARCGAHVPVSL